MDELMAALFDPSLLIVVAVFAVFSLLVVLTVAVLRWLILRRSPDVVAVPAETPDAPEMP